MRLSRVLVLSGLLLMVCVFLAACGGSSPKPAPPPPLTITNSTLPQATVNVPYSIILNGSGGMGSYTWSITAGSLPPGLSLDGQKGVISGTPTTAGTFSFTTQLMDGANHTATANLSIAVGGALIITCDSCATGTLNLPYGNPGVPYNPSGTPTFSATGGIAPYTWCVIESSGACDNGTGGALPVGLTITTDSNGNGVISGTPTSQPAAPVQIMVQVTDSETPRASGSETVSLTIFSIATTMLPSAVINQPYKGTVTAAGGTGSAKHPYTWSVTSGSLPLGLGLCTKSSSPVCAISGTPTQLGLSTFTVSVADGETPPAMAMATLSIDVHDTTLTITTTTLPAGIVNVSYSAIVQSTGGDGNNTWSIASGTLPPGLTLNTSTGAITGMPTTQGASAFVVQVQDGENPPQVAMSGTLGITVNAPVTNLLLNGNYAFAFNGFDNGTPFVMAGAFIADGSGNITGGKLDRNDGHGSEINDPSQCRGNLNCPVAEVMQSPGSTYDLSSGNGLGTITISTVDHNGNPHSYKFSIAVSANACVANVSLSDCGRLIQRDSSNPNTYGSGILKVQDNQFFVIDKFFPGNFALLASGIDPSGGRYAAAGAVGTNPSTLVDIDCGGNGWNLSGCPLDTNDNGSAASDPFGGTFAADLDSNTGRGNFVNIKFPNDPNGYCLGGLSHPTCGYAYYIVNKQEMILLSGDPLSKPANLTLWSAFRQRSTGTGWSLASLSGPIVTELSAAGGGASNVTAGIFTADGKGNATFSSDQNNAGTLSQQMSSGTYAIDSNGKNTGKVTLSGFTQFGTNGASMYLYTGNKGYIVGTDASVTSGVMEQQTGAPFTNASVIGSLEGGTAWPAVTGVTNSAEWMFADGNGNIIATEYTSGPGGVGGPTNLTLTYQVDSTGRAVVSQNGTEFGILYVVGPSKFVMLPTGNNPALSVFITGQPD